MLDALLRDVRFAIRGIYRQPGVSLTVMVILGAAIGLNATLMTFVVGVLVRPWGGISAPSEVVRLYVQDPTGLATGLSIRDAQTLASSNRSFSGVGVMRSESVRVGEAPGSATRALMIDSTLFDVLGVTPVAGRRFTAADDRPGAPGAVVILGYEYWTARFGAASSAVGSTLRINDVLFTVVGVAPQDFTHSEPGYDTQLFLPVQALPLLSADDSRAVAILTDSASCCADVVARLRPGTTIDRAAAEFDVLARGFTAVSGARASGGVVTDTAFASQPGRRDSGQALAMGLMLAGALVLVWLIACANIGNLLLARAASRLREMGTRLALGASRARLIRQLLTEGVVLAVLAGGVGVVIASQLPFVILRLVAGPEADARFPFEVRPDAWVLAYVLLLGAGSVIAFALAPALLVTRSALRHTATHGLAILSGRLTLRSVLLAVQVAVSVVLLVTAALLIRGAQEQAAEFDPGFDVDDMTLLSLELPEGTYNRARATALFTEVNAAAEQLTGAAFAFASHQPFSQYRNGTSFHLPGEGRDRARQLLYLDVSPRYLELLRIPLTSGRYFDDDDTGRSLVVINETMARRYWPGRSAVGQTFFMRPRGPVDQMVTQEVVGVVRDVRATTFAEPVPMFYRAVMPGTEVFDYISADPRASQPPVLLVKGETAAAALAHAITQLDDRIRIKRTSLPVALETMLASAQWGPVLAATLGVFALGLASIGMFGVFAYAVHQRRREIGIRMALGAHPAAVIRLILTSHSRAVAFGLAAGLLGAVAASAGLRSRLHGVSPFDPLACMAVAAILAVCGVAATYLPARRAARVSPLESLRAE